MTTKILSEWQCGKSGGCLKRDFKIKTAWRVRFVNPLENKFFCEKDYNTPAECLKAAELWRYQISEQRKMVKNKYRHVETNGYMHLEVQLQNNKTFYCDMQDLSIVERVTWSYKPGVNTFYAHHSSRALTNLKMEMFHRLVTSYSCVDHIDGNGLNNIRSNLRDGSGSVNCMNQSKRKDNLSGITGVSYSQTEKQWVAQWMEDGERRKKRFSDHRFGDKAKQTCIDFKIAIDKQLGLQNGTSNPNNKRK